MKQSEICMELARRFFDNGFDELSWEDLFRREIALEEEAEHRARKLLNFKRKDDCTEPNRAACPRKCMDFCNKVEQAKIPAGEW